MKNKVIAALLILTIGLSVAACSQNNGNHNRNNGEPDSDVEVADQKANKDYFTFNKYKSDIELSGLTDEGKKQEYLVIPSGVVICCSLSDGSVKHVAFESDDDVDLSTLLSCSKTLETVKLPANLTKLTSIGSCPNLKEITIPKGVTEIPGSCFVNDKALETVTIEGDVTTIGKHAFKGCESLKSINIPDSVTIIDREAFFGCKSLETITLPKGLKVVGDSAFINREAGIKTIIVPEELELEEWDGAAFVQVNEDYTVKVVKGSWADLHFDEVFAGNAKKKYV